MRGGGTHSTPGCQMQLAFPQGAPGSSCSPRLPSRRPAILPQRGRGVKEPTESGRRRGDRERTLAGQRPTKERSPERPLCQKVPAQPVHMAESEIHSRKRPVDTEGSMEQKDPRLSKFQTWGTRDQLPRRLPNCTAVSTCGGCQSSLSPGERGGASRARSAISGARRVNRVRGRDREACGAPSS